MLREIYDNHTEPREIDRRLGEALIVRALEEEFRDLQHKREFIEPTSECEATLQQAGAETTTES